LGGTNGFQDHEENLDFGGKKTRTDDPLTGRSRRDPQEKGGEKKKSKKVDRALKKMPTRKEVNWV